jgi:hypothetical protein
MLVYIEKNTQCNIYQTVDSCYWRRREREKTQESGGISLFLIFIFARFKLFILFIYLFAGA